jgi:tetratricopeptide (TPR) repeat protein
LTPEPWSSPRQPCGRRVVYASSTVVFIGPVIAIPEDSYYDWDFAGAEVEYKQAIQLNPNAALPHQWYAYLSAGDFWLARIYLSQGRYDEAEAALQEIGPLRPWTPAMAVFGYLYGRTGRRDAACRVLADFDEPTRAGRYASGYARPDDRIERLPDSWRLFVTRRVVICTGPSFPYGKPPGNVED